ncbi:hypothetical protein, variant [Saprolegnia diclina VS20]|uniref:Uncharacterized protein n=1 Tax=Saprolegnia diclina (strain VS20) TaxID=1156394 RepID=T0R0L5_SAPDV|nr:hypothetical protein SDRG_02360 [Saprolegnia diclina VS20]XP_008606166.1 hypothetical protein, variant [Saprolegnia diclina VS20]EQC40466.1 hypothetical protein SDRG_02360 [Saprolegnia diclina VS20]EQC40467.1 hypothetical protein, variant [Saprolegnia diclina VS20]|eukprot:XP_008606165.1 hypothetical protein SDRG_02360 [Saprolegnia diclina VS20]
MLEFQSAVDDVVAATYVPATMELIALGSTCVLRHKVRPSAQATTPLWRHGADVDVHGSRLLCSTNEYILLQLAGDASLALYNAGADTMLVEAIPSSLQQPFLVAAISPTGATVVLLASDHSAAVRWRVRSLGKQASVEPSAWSSISLPVACGTSWAAPLHSRLLGSVFAVGHVALQAVALDVHTTYMCDDDDGSIVFDTRVRSLSRPSASTSVLSVALHGPSQCLAIVVAPSTVVFASIATDHEVTYATPETIMATAWHPRLPHLVVSTAQGSIYVVHGHAGTGIKAPLLILATSMPPDLHFSVFGDSDRAKLLVHSATSIRLYALQVAPPPPAPSSSPLCNSAPTPAQPAFVSAFLKGPPADVNAALDAFLVSSSLCMATQREHLLPKLVAVAVHTLHPRVTCFSIRSLVFFLFHVALHAPLDCIDRLANLLRDAPPADHWAPNYANLFEQLRAPRRPLPYAPAVAAYLATLDVDPAHTRALGSYDVAAACRLADVAWLRQQPHDVAYLQALGCVLALHYLGLTPHMLLGRHLMALTLWAELPPVAQWSRPAALQLVAKLEALCHFVLQMGATFTTASTESFLRDLCAERSSLHLVVCARYMATVLHVYRTLPVLSDLDVTGAIADVDGLHTASPFLAAYRVDTTKCACVAVASAREAAATAFVVRRLHAVRAHLAASDHGLPCLFALLGTGAPPLYHVAKLLQPSLPLLGLTTSAPSTYAPCAATIARTVVWTVWAAVARDAAAISLRAKLPGGIWHVVRVNCHIFGLSVADSRSVQLAALHESLSWTSTPLETAHALAYLRASSIAPTRLTKREQRLVAEVNLRIGSNYVETKQALLERQLGAVGGALRLVRGDALFWHLCQQMGLDSSPSRVTIIEDRADDVQSYSDAISRLEVLELLHAQETALAHHVVATTKTLVQASRPPPIATSCQATATDAVPQTTTATQVHSTAIPRVLLKLRSDTALPTPPATLAKRSRSTLGRPPSSEAAPSCPQNEAIAQAPISSKQSSRNVLQLLQLQKAKLREPAAVPRSLERARTMVPPPPLVQPLTFSGHDPSTAHLKLLRKAASMTSVPLRPKTFEPHVRSARVVLPTAVSDATPIQDASSQTAKAEDIVEPPTRLVQETATNTERHDVDVDSTQTEATSFIEPIAVKKPPPFPVFVQLQSKQPAPTYLRVMDIAPSTPTPVVASRDTLAVAYEAVTAVEGPSEGSAPTAASPPAPDAPPIDTTRSEASVEGETPSLASEAPVGLARFSSMKQQLDDMRKRLADIEQFADAIDSDFTASHEMMNRIEVRRRAMMPSTFAKQLSALEATHTHLASSIASTKAKLTPSSPAPPRTSVLATEAAANVADATRLLQQLEASLLPPTTTNA